MKIRKMTANFGTLENETLTLSDGLNVIYSPNEGGKSTWCAFLRAMLYGVDSSQREKNGVKPDKVRYAPWSGTPMSGEMEIEYEGREITLARTTRTSTAPMREFSAVYTGTAESVDGLNGTDVGEQMTGMSRAVFDSSVFIRQSGMGIESSADLEKRINAIVSTGEESNSYTEANRALGVWLRKRRHNNTGAIPAMNAEIREKTESIARLESASRRRDDALERLSAVGEEMNTLREQSRQAAEKFAEEKQLALERWAKQCKNLSDELDRAEQSARIELVQSVDNSRAAVNERRRALDSLREDSQRLSAYNEMSPFAGMSGEQARAEAEKAKTAALALAAAAEKKPSPALIIVGALLIAAGIALGVFVMPYVFGLSAAGAAVLVGGSVRYVKDKNARENARREYTRTLSAFGADSPEGVVSGAEEYARRCGELVSLDRQSAEMEALLSKAEEERRLCETALVSGEDTPAVAAKRRELAQAEERARFIEMQTESAEMRASALALSAAAEKEKAAATELAEAGGAVSALGDAMVIKTELESLSRRREELQSEYDAIALGMSVLKEANDEMQQRFSPELGKCASEYMEKLTGGRYDRLVFDRELNARARLAGSTADHERGFLSAGTADQLYLALRLAICRLALEEDRSCPLILDDALVNFDDTRMERAIDLLTELAGQRQILLFTCHRREGKYLERRSKTVS